MEKPEGRAGSAGPRPHALPYASLRVRRRTSAAFRSPSGRRRSAARSGVVNTYRAAGRPYTGRSVASVSTPIRPRRLRAGSENGARVAEAQFQAGTAPRAGLPARLAGAFRHVGIDPQHGRGGVGEEGP
ncbi:hypothetical protein ACF061_27685 [Streptomyces sp. NPDC015220]|uniref:hypothetical protein n=1 Tax=Streptomyces sp. NPDC015220 TaxID=3364947 RepID=UPI0037012338